MSEAADQPVVEEALAPAPEAGVAEAEAPSDTNDSTDEEGDAPTDEELEEVKIGDKTYSVPKELAKELNEGGLRQKDYTQKTQSVAERAKALEAREAETARNAELVTSLREDYGAVHALKAHVDYFNKVDWATYNVQNPQAAQADWMAYQQAKDQLRDASEAVTAKETDLREARERTAANARAETGQALAKDIKGWGPELANKLAEFATDTYGVNRDQLRNIDAPTWRLIHDAYEGRQIKAKAQAATRLEKVQAVAPAIAVRGNAPASNAPSDKDSTEAWLRKRNAQLAKSGSR